MKLKTVEVNGVTYAEVSDNKPIYLGDDNKEIAFDAPHTAAKIRELNGEAKGHREAKEALEGRLRAFEGISDPGAALRALETVKNLDDKKLIDAGQVETIKAEAKRAYEEQLRAVEERYKPVVAEAEKLRTDLHSEKVGGAFSRSKYIADKIAVPPDMLQATFGARFNVEDGKVVALGQDGGKIFSRARPGEIAEFDEALEIMVDGYAFRDHILKGSGASGGGAQGGGGTGGGKTIPRATFDTWDASQQMSHVKSGGTVLD